MKKIMIPLLALFFLAFFAAPRQAPSWCLVEQELYPQQDEAFKVVQNGKENREKVDLSFCPADHPAKMLAAFDSKIVPDVDFSQIVNVQTGNFAYEDNSGDLRRNQPDPGPLHRRRSRASEFLNSKTASGACMPSPSCSMA
jgi:hypothetical protein